MKPVIADVPPVTPCDECGSTELKRKMYCVICADCRIVRQAK